MSQRKSFLLFPEPDEAAPLDYLNEDVDHTLEEVLDKKEETDPYKVFDTKEQLLAYERTHNIRGIPIMVETDLPKEDVVKALMKHSALFVAEHVKKVNDVPTEFRGGKFVPKS